MKKFLGLILRWLLISIGIVLLLPTAFGLLCFWAVTNLVCWSNGKHTYDPQQILTGINLKSMRCIKCNKLISQAEEARVQAQIDVFVASLRQSREFLNDVFATPEERAVDTLINDSRNTPIEN